MTIGIRNLAATPIQTVFDEMVTHLREQGEPSYMEEGSSRCMYLNKDGLKCAVGILIADDEYRPDIEQMPVDSLITVLNAPYPNETMVQLLINMQDMHDTIDPMHWEECFGDFAKMYNLKYTPIEALV